MDRNKAKELRETLQEAVDLVAEQHGVSIKVGNCRYTASNATFKVEVAEIDESGQALTKEAEDFKRYAKGEGLNPEDLGRQFRSRGKLFEVVGLAARSRKYPILAKELNSGKIYKHKAITVKMGLAAVS